MFAVDNIGQLLAVERLLEHPHPSFALKDVRESLDVEADDFGDSRAPIVVKSSGVKVVSEQGLWETKTGGFQGGAKVPVARANDNDSLLCLSHFIVVFASGYEEGIGEIGIGLWDRGRKGTKEARFK